MLAGESNRIQLRNCKVSFVAFIPYPLVILVAFRTSDEISHLHEG